MANATEKQNARELKKSKRNDGLLTKLGTGKVGRYGKAAMLTAGLMAPGGPSGYTAFKEQENVDQANQTTIRQETKQQEERGGERFFTPDNPETYNANISTGQSSVSTGDQAAMRRRLEASKMQDRNTQSQTEQSGQPSKDTSAVGQDKEAGKSEKSLRSRWQKVKNERNKIKDVKSKIADSIGIGGATGQAASKAANQAIRQAYSQAQTVVEEALLDVFYFIFILGLPYFILWAARPLIAMIGIGTVTIKKFNVKVKAVPGYEFDELMMRLAILFVIAVIFAIEWLLIVIVVWFLTEPLKATFELGFGVIFDIVSTFF